MQAGCRVSLAAYSTRNDGFTLRALHEGAVWGLAAQNYLKVLPGELLVRLRPGMCSLLDHTETSVNWAWVLLNRALEPALP